MKALVLLIALAVLFGWSCLLVAFIQWAPRAEYWDATFSAFGLVVAGRILFGARDS